MANTMAGEKTEGEYIITKKKLADIILKL